MHQPLRYAYNTNGCTNHRLSDALRLMADAGYDGVALTLDWHHLDPFAADWKEQARKLRGELGGYGLGCVIETGARYLLDPAHKHQPTLLHPTPEGRQRRVDFLQRAVDIGAILEAETVSCWSGIQPPSLTRSEAHQYLVEGLVRVADYASARGVSLSLEPEPGMLIERNADYEALLGSHPALQQHLRLALDLGHVWVTGESAPDTAITQYVHRLGTVSIEGMARGVHHHLPLHEGDMAIPPLLAALKAVAFRGLICVELSRESPRAHLAIPESIQLLQALEREINS
ncbi:sugar phosphate isomerase/epimerase [Neolewinella xylanilytica]|uniref:Sugar phosphate isomerase/epimerase n=1 Tax=Neolewinella xylanilytica TaxID=1514080 RepID=A0A2S6I684_9BACT|nr:sugar phosphate isomerase/epimerase family protein [Neolewinella xylanilytica]PPK86674.1 sugar phosphate isomerase/epimerase [Neolewinella xylanilytica]